jgi:hypothetical protein
MMNQEMRARVQSLLETALTELDSAMSATDKKDIRDYIEHDEYGVAWELFWSIAKEDQLVVPPSLAEAGRLMNFDTNDVTATREN